MAEIKPVVGVLYGGLGDRMRDIAGAIAIAKRLDKPLELAWVVNWHICKTYRKVIFHNTPWATWLPGVPRGKAEGFCKNRRNKSHLVVENARDHLHPGELEPGIKSLQFQQEIVERAQQLIEPLPRPIIGVHLRNGDKGKLFPAAHEQGLAKCAERASRLVNAFSCSTLLCSDDPSIAIEGAVRPPNSSPAANRVGPEALKEAARDMLALSMCDIVLNSVGSFAYVASRYGDAKLLNLWTGQDTEPVLAYGVMANEHPWGDYDQMVADINAELGG